MLRLSALGLAGSALLFAQTYAPGPQNLTFASSVDDSQQPYAVYLPQNFDPARTYPLVVSLHAEESNHRLNLMQVLGQGNRLADVGRLPLNRLRLPHDLEFIVASPLARGTMGYRGIAEKDVYDMLADVKRRFHVDEDRVYLTGISMGGGGALWLAVTRPDIWAAVAVICPAPAGGAEALAGNALNLPMRLFQGDQDPLVPVAYSRQWQRRLLDAGVAADYLEYPAVRHNAWDLAYKDGALFDWFARFRRQRYPERVRFVTTSYRYDAAYWVRLDGLTPGVPASIDARQTGPAAVNVTTRNVDGFTLALDHPVTAVEIDGATLRVRAAAAVSFHRQAGKWTGGIIPAAGKRPGLEGPIEEAVSGRHLYVYGTAGAPSAEELDFRRRQAQHAAAWSSDRERLQVSWRVKADSAVTQQDIDNDNLVLFGTRETNSLIDRFADRLPLALDAGAADYGLLFIAAVGKHYALVNSGLPWWTDFDDSGRLVDQFAPKTLAQLETFSDYVLFKGSVAHVVAEGRFDRNWKVPIEGLQKLTGEPVSIR